MGQFILNGRNYSGITYANGCFIDTDNLITSGQHSSSNPLSYTATSDCYIFSVVALTQNSSGAVYIDGKQVASWYNGGGTTAFDFGFFLKKGQTITTTQTFSGDSDYKVYGIQEGSPVTFLSEYASACYDTTEREVGCWVDGKPIYQRTWEFGSSVLVSYSSWTNTTIDSSDIENIITVKAKHSDGTCFEGIMADPTVSGHTLVGLQTTRNGAEANVKTLTLQYTKISDVAGSGKLTPTAMPTVHYDSNEKIIGTWFGETLYEKVISLTSGIAIGSYGHISLPANSIVRGLDGYAYQNSHASVDRFNGFINSGDLYASIKSGQIEYWISNIFSPVEEITFTIQYTKTT